LDHAERAAFNGLLGAADEDGEDWCYFTLPNGRRNNTYHWACCKSSGAMGLELAAQAVARCEAGVWHQRLWTSCEGTMEDGTQVTARLGPAAFEFRSTATCKVRLRIPSWAEVARPHDGEWMDLDLEPERVVGVSYKARLETVPKTFTLEHHGQEVVREEYVSFQRGPFVLALGLAPDSPRPPLLCLSHMFPQVREAGDDSAEVILPGQKPIVLEPYFRAGGRHHHANRHVWMPVVWQ
jgi:hypothetical protein